MDTRHTTGVSKYTALFSWGLRLGDLGIVVAAGVLAYGLRFGNFDLPLEYTRSVVRGLIFSLLVFGSFPLYRSWRGRTVFGELATMVGAYGTMFVCLALFSVALKFSAELSRVWVGEWVVASLIGGALARIVVRSASRWTRMRGMDLRNAVVVGGGRDAHHIIKTLQQHAWSGIRVTACFRTEPGSCAAIDGIPCGGEIADLAEYVEREQIDQVWVALPMREQDCIGTILDVLKDSTADVKFVPDLFGLQLLNQSVQEIAGLPVINLRASPLEGEKRLLKALEDRVGALLILLLIAPLLALLALGVRLSSPGPILFRQKRHGIDGKVIEVWKFRTMRVHSETDGKVTQATRCDPRVTRLGRFLRRTSLDELPQFFNVLQGTMSIVGPRPHAVAHNQQFKDVVQDYMQRHRVKPGITGWAQVNGLRGETDTLEKMRSRVEHDLYYMQHWSVLMDVQIIVRTVITGFLHRNAY